jgi:hypothetical protein
MACFMFTTLLFVVFCMNKYILFENYKEISVIRKFIKFVIIKWIPKKDMLQKNKIKTIDRT